MMDPSRTATTKQRYSEKDIVTLVGDHNKCDIRVPWRLHKAFSRNLSGTGGWDGNKHLGISHRNEKFPDIVDTKDTCLTSSPLDIVHVYVNTHDKGRIRLEGYCTGIIASLQIMISKKG